MSGPIAELIAQLSAEDPFCPEIPEAALRWSESEVRVWFASDGRVQPASSSPRRGEHPEPVRAYLPFSGEGSRGGGFHALPCGGFHALPRGGFHALPGALPGGGWASEP